MATIGISSGRNKRVVAVHVFAPSGGQLNLQTVVSFDAKPKYHTLKVAAISGKTRSLHIPDEYDISIGTERGNNELDLFVAALDAAYRAGTPIPSGQIYAYTTEADGSVTTEFYDDCSFFVNDLGTWKKDSTVTQTLMATASTRTVL
jgi:hypothetical protein